MPALFIGLDVGGTCTDAALLGRGRLLATAKVPTRPGNALPGIVEALREIAAHEAFDASAVARVCVSGTIGLNALLSGAHPAVGMLVLPGPGIDPRLFWPADPLFKVLGGAEDHRGRVTAAPDEGEIAEAVRFFLASGVAAIGIVCKFSPKNPELELRVAQIVSGLLPDGGPLLALGSRAGGGLGFPRRMHTVWCNAALGAINSAFMRSLELAAGELGLSCPLTALKSDAGVIAAAEAARDPAACLGAGPAASLLGVWALAGSASGGFNARPGSEDILMIDMGGTTTDLALLAKGSPLLGRSGLRVNGRDTLIRTLWTRSIALGGDSSLRLVSGAEAGPLPRIGPDRSGPALALSPDEDLGKRPPTLSDAMNVLGLCRLGDPARSLAAMRELAAHGAREPLALAGRFVDEALARIRAEAAALLAEVNEKPVYTIHELLVEEPLKIDRALIIGGPARALAGIAGKFLGFPVHVPDESASANAVGAALARPTATASLYADTLLGRSVIPEFGLEAETDGGYTTEKAARDLLAAFAMDKDGGPDKGADFRGEARIIEQESFAVIDDRGRRGRNIRLRAQRLAGLLPLLDPAL